MTNFDSPLWFYSRFLWLFAVVAAMVGFNFAKWGFHRPPSPPVMYVADARPEQGPELLESYGCTSCHVIPGIRKATGTVGPRLDRLKERIYLAGSLPNTPTNLIRWLQDPPSIRPKTAMPNLGVLEEHARDMAAYLYEAQE